MGHLDFELVVRVSYFIDRDQSHLCVFYFFTSLVAEAPLGVDYD